MNGLVEKFRDTTGRKPSGWLGKRLYRRNKAHRKSFEEVVEKMELREDDVYLDVCCGGGELLQMALMTVVKAAAVDHSPDMVELTRERNREAVEKGLVEIVEGSAESLPWQDEQFTCATCANAFFFVEHPLRVIGEIYRVLKPEGRLVIHTMSKKASLMGMIFSRPYGLKAYTDDEMSSMLYQAGFTAAEVRTNGAIQLCYAQK